MKFRRTRWLLSCNSLSIQYNQHANASHYNFLNEDHKTLNRNKNATLPNWSVKMHNLGGQEKHCLPSKILVGIPIICLLNDSWVRLIVNSRDLQI